MRAARPAPLFVLCGLIGLPAACESPEVVNKDGTSLSPDKGGAGTGGRKSGSGGSGGFSLPPPSSSGQGGSGTPSTIDPDGAKCGKLIAVVRDFKAEHGDFEKSELNTGRFDGIVRPELGPDGLPVYAPEGPTRSTSGKENFDQWYRDVEGTNMRFEVELPLTRAGNGVSAYDNSSFFPLDGKGWPGQDLMGADGQMHNFHFTTEIRGKFKYRGGEVFTFRGDDDVFVFVNGKLALDLGGVHGVVEGTIDFDARAAELGLKVGEMYPLDVFHAERHTKRSNFRIQTSIECLVTVIE